MAGSLQIKHGTKIQVAYDVPPGQQPQFNMICTFNKALDESAFLVSIPIVDGKMLIPGETQKLLFRYGEGNDQNLVAGYVDDVVKEGITVPLSAVVFDNNLNSKIVFIYNPSTQKVELRKVSDEGIIVGRNDLIVSGNIEPGEQVVSAGASYLVDGQQVKILTE